MDESGVALETGKLLERSKILHALPVERALAVPTFDQIFDSYRGLVYNLGLRLLGDRDEALDLSQEVFFVVFQKIDQFRSQSSLKTWIYRITLNRASNRNRWWRRRQRDRIVSLDLPEQAAPAQHLAGRGVDPERACLQSELDKQIGRALKRLPLDQRISVVLRDIQELSYEEIAEITGTSLGTIKSRIARGRESLRQHLRKYLRNQSVGQL
jgi:RNA polymerase sigma-70 factor (ECF subfamily)